MVRNKFLSKSGTLAAIAMAFASPMTFADQATSTKAAVTPAQPTTADLLEKINALQNEVNLMKATQPQPAISAKDIDQTVDRVLHDADRRSQFLAMDGVTAGWDKGRFFIGSGDGNFVLKPWLHLQVRDGTAVRNDAKASRNDDVQNGFEIRRARFGADGNAFTPDFTFNFDWATYRGNSTATVKDPAGANIGTVSQGNGGLPVLEEAWGKYQFHDTPYAIRAGQIHDPLDHEAIVGSKFRQPEVSLTGDIFANTDTFTQGATFIYDPKDVWRFEGGITDGIRAANTNFADYPNNGTQYDFGFAGRVEYKVMGNWGDYSQLTSLHDKQDLLVFGLGVDNSQGGRDNQFSHTLDVEYADTGGLFLYGSYFGRYISDNKGIPNGAPTSTSFGTPAVSGRDTYEYSLLGMAGYLIDQKYEPFIRYEYLYLQGTPTGSQDNVHEISLGMNYYIYGHNAKLTGQVMYLPNGIPISDDSNDVLISNNRDEVVFIAQFQLLL